MKTNNIKTCAKCNQNLPLKSFFYSKVRDKYMETCKECNSKISCQYQSERRKAGDVNYLLRQRAAGIRRDCKTRKRGTIEVSPDLGDLMIEQYAKQNGKCYYTGEDMTIKDYQKDDNFATIDRLNPAKGYVKGNIVFCLSIINKMKQDMTIEQFKKRCEQMAKFNP